LIDLNKEYINFDINFECRSCDASKDFEMLVINQEQLNTIDLTNLTMKKTRSGYISGNIVADENKYQNYFLVIRALDEQPLEIDLDISLKPIPPKEGFDAPAPVAPIQEDFSSSSIAVSPTADTSFCKKIVSSPFYFVCVVLVLVALGVGIYYYMKHKKNGVLDTEHETVEKAPSVVSSSSSKSSKSSAKSGPLLERLMKGK